MESKLPGLELGDWIAYTHFVKKTTEDVSV
jgi:hypothetical protein